MRRLTGEDNSFLAWESIDQPQHTIKVLVLDPRRGTEPITFAAVRAALPALAHRVAPLTWQLLLPRLGFGRPWWVSRPDLDLDYHLHHATAAAPGDDRALGDAISAFCIERLDRRRPAWQLCYVDGLADGRVALVFKIHHALADGTASVRLLETLCDTTAGTPLPGPPARPPAAGSRPPAPQWLPLVAAHQRAALAAFPSLLARTGRVTRTILARRRAGKPGYAEAFAAPGAVFNAPLTPDRRFAFRGVELATVKAVAKGFGVTVNDVFLTVCAGALRDYLDRRGELAAEPLTAVVPVSMRPADGDPWGNKVARWNVALATEIADPVQRLGAIAAATRTAREVQAERDLWLQHDWMEYWPLFWFYSRALPLLGEKTTRRPTFSLIASNMRGPRPLFFGGAPVERLISTGPLVFPMGLNFTGWSYGDRLTIGVLACGRHIDDPWEIADGLPAELARLVAAQSAAEQRAGQPAAELNIQPAAGHRV
ncbi:wax ester/triacylglycerol synthase family O-acyltransferase [Mycobacterium sp. 1274756.6]|uniref:wax ester/triacylglycerol synthase family O-acyltransferase n=1 Tax=Mycobacterium sp. 1274756.6 TaxID=1834076 RepID=UPI0009ED44A2|nr:wax ester/triacylglycerol synthase family O-acyltransferase [Mycobacterium sp. 1274756.6]